MKRILQIFFLFLIASCETSDGVTASNYSYKFLVDKKGESPKVGDLVKFSETVYLNDKEISSTKEFRLKEIILPSKEMLTRPLPPNYEMLFQMSIGDSVAVTQELKDLEDLPEGFKTEDRLKYLIKLIDITPKEKVAPAKKKIKLPPTIPTKFSKKLEI